MNSNINNSRPIFVVGAPRSGTTLFQYMLRSHPNISLPTGESHFFIPLLRKADSFGDLSRKDNIRKVLEAMYKQSANFLDTDIHGLQFDIDRLSNELYQEGRYTIAAIIAGLFEKNALGEGKQRWGDKTPYYVLHMKTLLQSFPDAQFIHLIRDGRDCALSMFERKHDFGVYNIFFAAKYWEIYVELGRQMGLEFGDGVYHEIRYEDLLENPAQIMRGVCEFLKEPYSDSLVNFKKSGEAGKTPLLQKPVQNTNKEKWREKMTLRQITLFEGAVMETLKTCGYPLITHARPIPLPIKALWRFHNYIFNQYRKLYIKRKRK
ncbi:MAG: sulfotransferase [Gammaproteobacteria bacterium]|nr:sulfotransferase [Gammaproteobacteria bacterium]